MINKCIIFNKNVVSIINNDVKKETVQVQSHVKHSKL